MSKENENNENNALEEDHSGQGDACVKEMAFAMSQMIDAHASLHADGSCNLLNVRTILHLAERIKHEASLIVDMVGQDFETL